MSDDSAAAIRQERRNWMAQHRETYLKSGGTQGHVMDISEIGGHAFTTHCLIRLQGRKSGQTRITPLIYGDIGGEVVIVASKGGADSHPEWYLNLRASEHVDLQIATQHSGHPGGSPKAMSGTRSGTSWCGYTRPTSPIRDRRRATSPSS